MHTKEWIDLSKSLDGDQHRRAFSRGIRRWSDYASCCLDGVGPAGVVRKGSSKRLQDLRAEADGWGSKSGSNPFALVTARAISHVQLANGHCSGIAVLLERTDTAASIAVVIRSWIEASARAVWLLEPEATARQIVTRTLLDWLEDGRRLAQMKRGRDEAEGRKGHEPLRNPLESTVLEAASNAGLPVERRGKEIVIDGQNRPNTLEVLRHVDKAAWAKDFPNLIPSMYRRSCAVVHASFLGWAETVVGRGPDGVADIGWLQLLATDLTSALELHSRAVDAWNSCIKWAPEDLMTEAKRSSLAGHGLAFAQLLQALRYKHERDAQARSAGASA